MCLILFALDQHPDLPLVVAANRDEFYRRPTAAMTWWPGNELLAGQDLESGGTWLAIDRNGLVTAVTNVREGTGEAGRHTRGELPLQALTTEHAQLRQRLADEAGLYAGFNLIRLDPALAGPPASGWYYSNRDAHPGRNLYRGSYGLSNHLLQSPWPKLVRLREQLRETIRQPQPVPALHDQLLQMLQDRTQAPDALLPDTGIDRDFERFLSSPFIVSDYYGTRASTVVTVDRGGHIRVTEQSWGTDGRSGERREFEWNAH